MKETSLLKLMPYYFIMVRGLQCRVGSCITLFYSLVARAINSGGAGKYIDLCCHPEMKCHVEQLCHCCSNILPIPWCCVLDFKTEILGDLCKNLDLYRSHKSIIVTNCYFSVDW